MLEPERIIRLEDVAVVVLDQRRLPDEEVELRCASSAEVAEAMRTLAVRGAPAVAIAAAYGYALAARRGEDLDAAGAALRALLAHVLVDETRPLLQGARLTAWELDVHRAPYAQSLAWSLVV
jgi:methylthioribose-1-phosphate isomerase